MREYPKYGKKADAGVNQWASYLAELRVGLNEASMQVWAQVNDGVSVYNRGSPVYQDYKFFLGLFYGWYKTTKNYLKMYDEDQQMNSDDLTAELGTMFQTNFKMLSGAVRKNAVITMLNKQAQYNDLVDKSPLQKIIEEAVIWTDQG